MRYVLAVLVVLGLAFQHHPALADCKDEVHEPRQDINDDRKDYTAAARAEAKKHLAAAELTLLKPLECRENLRKARQALRKCKKDLAV